MAAAQLAGATLDGLAEPVSPCAGINDINVIDQMPGYWLVPRRDRPAKIEPAPKRDKAGYPTLPVRETSVPEGPGRG
jgi:hypothetical protein